jgi:hypothetical protein
LSRKKRDSCWKFFKILGFDEWEAMGVVSLIIQGKEEGGNWLADRWRVRYTWRSAGWQKVHLTQKEVGYD